MLHSVATTQSTCRDDPPTFSLVSSRFAFAVVVFLAYFGITILLQWASGTYAGDFGGYPDEPGHYVTGLMVRDYVAERFPDSPMTFAENYSCIIPKVALDTGRPYFIFWRRRGCWSFPRRARR